MFRRNIGAMLIAVLALTGASAARAVDGELVATSVTFTQLPGNTWMITGDYEVTQWTSAAWDYAYTFEQWRGGNLLTTIETGDIEVPPASTGWCSTFCNGGCYIGTFRGVCTGTGSPCGCNIRPGRSVLVSPQTGESSR